MSDLDDFKTNPKKTNNFKRVTIVLIVSLFLAFLIFKPGTSIFKSSSKTIIQNKDDDNIIKNGIHLRTGLVEAEGLMTVVNNCTNCHSAKLIIQNRMDKDRWNATIKWMQETQNLWPLGENQEIIVNYLVRNYPPVEKGRRENLTNIEWYELKDSY